MDKNLIKIAVFFADGSEDLEALTPVDLLRRCDGVEVTTVSVCQKEITTSHGVKILADKLVSEIDLNSFDGYVIPGGMPGATNISTCEKVVDAIKNAQEKRKLVSAICASPAVVLAGNGLFKGKNITCYPAPVFVEGLKDYNYTAKDVEADGNLITANGPRSAFEFSKAVCKYLGLTIKF
jgi:4-methyl-5(b-hydroxyethyl)-thiazole monophosphate biosynthesis